MTDKRKILTETVTSVAKPPKGRVDPADIGAAQIENGHVPDADYEEEKPVQNIAPSPTEQEEMTSSAASETAAEKLERKRDYLDGFLSQKPEALPSGAPGGDLHDAIVGRLKEIFDPEIPVNIYDLGLIYGVEVTDNGEAQVTMTLTTPHCPVAESMPAEVEMTVLNTPGVSHAEVNLVWDPPWDPAKMSDEAKLELGML